MQSGERVGVLGATSHVGRAVVPLLTSLGFDVIALSRQAGASKQFNTAWALPSDLQTGKLSPPIPFWICLAPISILPEYFAALKAVGAQRVVALSSTSRFSKLNSVNVSEQHLAQRFIQAELDLESWAGANNVDWIVLRPTLIYGLGKDKNISEIIRLLRKFKVFPLLGQANGLRQPVHCEDVAQACVAALRSHNRRYNSYNLSGGETLTYREMVFRIFAALSMKPRFVKIPLFVMQMVFTALRPIPRYRYWSTSMAERMNQDLVFEHLDATRDLNFNPRPFTLASSDLPSA